MGYEVGGSLVHREQKQRGQVADVEFCGYREGFAAASRALQLGLVRGLPASWEKASRGESTPGWRRGWWPCCFGQAVALPGTGVIM